MILHTTRMFATTWPDAAEYIAAIVLGVVAVAGWPFARTLRTNAKWMTNVSTQSRAVNETQAAIAADLTTIKSDLAELKTSVAELDRVLKSVE